MQDSPPPTTQASNPPTSDDDRHAGMTAQELAEAKEYSHKSLICTLLDKGTDLVYLGLFAFLAAQPLDRWLSTFAPFQGRTARLAALFLIVIGIHELVSLPLSYYSGFVLEHRFGLSNLTFAAWLKRHIKRYLMAVVFSMVMFVGLYLVIWTVGSWWWLLAAGLFFLASVVLGQLTPVLILPLFYKIEAITDSQLLERMRRMAEGTGLSIEGIYRMGLSVETVKANAMLAGLGRTRRVLMGDTLLDNFSQEEIEVIFAHEIGHHVHRHIPKMVMLGLLYSTLGFWLCNLALAGQIGSENYDPTQLPVYTLGMMMFLLTVFSSLLEPLQNSISRHFERQSDRYALESTGFRQAYISAFEKLAKMNKDDPDPPPLEVFWFHSHPPINERLAMARH